MAHSPLASKADLRQDMYIVLPTAIALFILVIICIINPVATEKVLASLYGPFAKHTGTFYLWITLAMIALSIFFSVSKYGSIRFGEAGEKPEFSRAGWLAMMFCSGVAGAVLFWSIVEPLWNLAIPPQYAAVGSRESYEWALTYVLLHWGPVTWPWYVICALPICYMFYRLKKPVLRISAVAEPVIGKKATDGWAGRTLEILFIIGLLFSNTAVMGVSIPIVAAAISALTGLEPSFGMQIAILVGSAAIFTTSVSLGLKAGIKTLSYINAVIAVSMVLYCLIVGPTTQIVNSFTFSMGKMVNEFFSMIFWTAPWQESSFPQDWTIFYALWMASYGPFMGLFIARISKGRSVREIILMGVIGGISGSYLIHGIFGSYSIWAVQTGTVDAVSILQTSGGPAALIAILQSLPLPSLVLMGYVAFSTIFLATSVDSSAYIMACASTRKLVPGEEPTTKSRFFWAFTQSALALAVLSMGGLQAVRIFANFAGAFMIIPIIIGLIAWFKFIKYHDMDYEQRRLQVYLNEERKRDPTPFVVDPEGLIES